MNTPKWTVFTNIDNGHYVGMQWEFFDLEHEAQACCDAHNAQDKQCSTVRRFHETDRQHMGAIHKYE